MMDLDRLKKKLAKIKALAERGVGGEKETAIQLYNSLVEKYGLFELEEHDTELRWFRYRTETEAKLLLQICFMITGDCNIYKKKGSSSNAKLIGCECTDIEAVEIEVYFNHYNKFLKEEFDIFMTAFIQKNKLYPDETARCYTDPEYVDIESDEEEKMEKISSMEEVMEEHGRPARLLENN